jgi:hypothetical protein
MDLASLQNELVRLRAENVLLREKPVKSERRRPERITLIKISDDQLVVIRGSKKGRLAAIRKTFPEAEEVFSQDGLQDTNKLWKGIAHNLLVQKLIVLTTIAQRDGKHRMVVALPTKTFVISDMVVYLQQKCSANSTNSAVDVDEPKQKKIYDFSQFGYNKTQ